MRKKLGDCLIQAGLITQEDLHAALAEQRRTGERIGAVLVRLNLATEKQVTKALAHQAALPYVGLRDDPPERSAIVLIPREFALARVCVAVKLEGNQLTVATTDPLSGTLADDLQSLTGRTIRQVLATPSDILESIASGYPAESVAAVDASQRVFVVPQITADYTPQTIDSGPVPSAWPDDDRSFEPSDGANQLYAGADATAVDDLLTLVINRAIATGATDLHIDPRENGVVVRHRIDGVLTEPFDLPEWAHRVLAARIKQRAGLHVHETKRPQHGPLRVPATDKDVDLEAFTLPTLFGEKIVLRVRGLRKAPLPLEEIGLSASAMEMVRGFLRHSHGMVLVVGPSVSGKTTTLASALSSIDTDSKNIVTIEDAVEYRIRGVNQTQVNDTESFRIAAALTAILQQDPDVLLIGDLGDGETARIAMEAAQKRQLVLAGLYASNAPAAVAQLADGAVEPYVVGSALTGIIAQRLVRRLCVACRRQYTPDAETLRALAIRDASAAEMAFYHAVGCDECHHTGYRGRIALYEVMQVTDKLRRLIEQRAGEALVREAAIEAGMVPLGEDGLGKVKAGITTADELRRVVTEVREARVACPECGGPVATEFKVCPKCGHRLSSGCHKCGRALQSDWEYCAYCGATAHKKKKKSKDHNALDLPASNIAEFKNQNR